MRLIKEGDIYNDVIACAGWAGKIEYLPAIVEPDEIVVLFYIDRLPTTPYWCHINYYLCKIDAGYIVEKDDWLGLLYQRGFRYSAFIDWITEHYNNKGFSWQRGG